MKKLKRIYEEYSNRRKELIGYDYNGIIIEVDYSESNSYSNPWKKDGYIIPILKKLGKASYFETLKEAKEYIDKNF